MDGFIVDRLSLENEILKLTDWFTDDLFYSADDIMVLAGFSRIFCDVERFTDDSFEIMAQYGMGVLYEKNDNGEIIRKITPEFKNSILNDYYWKHHQNFSTAIYNQLNQFGKAVIIDCHSFPNNPLKRDLDKTPERPDFNIGTDAFHTPKHLIEVSKVFFENAGYSLGIDWPYRGSIVPLEHYNKNKNVQTIMLEINRTLYLKEPGNEKSDKYSEIKKVTGDFIMRIKNSMF
jgi:N-formylglutamate amidohydrolase